MHRANKKIAAVTGSGEVVKPDSPNGIKFEMFVFDALPAATNPLIVETERAEDFSPVKNAEGLDSPESCRNDLLRLYSRWAKAAGAEVAIDESGLPEINFEIDFKRGFDLPSFLARPENTRMPAIEEGTVF